MVAHAMRAIFDAAANDEAATRRTLEQSRGAVPVRRRISVKIFGEGADRRVDHRLVDVQMADEPRARRERGPHAALFQIHP